jgi:hypothetical protein
MIAGAGSLLALFPPGKISSPAPIVSEPRVLGGTRGVSRGFANAARYLKSAYESKIAPSAEKG